MKSIVSTHVLIPLPEPEPPAPTGVPDPYHDEYLALTRRVATLTNSLTPLIGIPSLQTHVETQREILQTWQQRITLLHHWSTLWDRRFTGRGTERIWNLFQQPSLPDASTPVKIMEVWRQWERLGIFQTIRCRTSTQLPHHYVLIAQSGSERWILAYWGPTTLSTLTSSRLLDWLSTPLPLMLLTGGWALVGIVALIGFVVALDRADLTGTHFPAASLFLYLAILCGLLAIAVEPGLEWLLRVRFTQIQNDPRSDRHGLPHIEPQ